MVIEEPQCASHEREYDGLFGYRLGNALRLMEIQELLV